MHESVFCLRRYAAAGLAALVAFGLAFFARPGAALAQSTNNPLSYARFAFIAGEWSHENLDTAAVETLSVAPILESGMLKAIFKSIDVTSGEPFTELWLIGWDPSGDMLYMDAYSTGGFRSVMDGKMVVPGTVWVFETPSRLDAKFRERRTVTKISDDEMAIKYEFAFGTGPIGNPIGRKYIRTAPYTLSSTELETEILAELGDALVAATDEIPEEPEPAADTETQS